MCLNLICKSLIKESKPFKHTKKHSVLVSHRWTMSMLSLVCSCGLYMFVHSALRRVDWLATTKAEKVKFSILHVYETTEPLNRNNKWDKRLLILLEQRPVQQQKEQYPQTSIKYKSSQILSTTIVAFVKRYRSIQLFINVCIKLTSNFSQYLFIQQLWGVTADTKYINKL